LPSLLGNLRQYAVGVKQLAAPDRPLGVGLWIPQDAAAELVADAAGAEDQELVQSLRLRDELAEMGLRPYTINGFPYGNFHQEVVKHQVYQPTWADPRRLRYTQRLVRILDALLPPGQVGSISTLPIQWGPSDDETERVAGENLRRLADELDALEQETGRRIVIAIEPEPGCALDTSTDIVEFFGRQFPKPRHRRYLTVCHDICHAAVMTETQGAVLDRYASNGITIGKVQVSSAIEVPWREMDQAEAQLALAQLGQFAEDRYLHQTGVVDDWGSFHLVEDLPELLRRTPSKPSDPLWRIHFHVPIFLDRFGQLRGTRNDVVQALAALRQIPESLRIDHLEVETYAWGVLPVAMRAGGLAASIAAEMNWLHQTLDSDLGSL
jgi:hypothetical protein